jgi:hypothetical protein
MPFSETFWSPGFGTAANSILRLYVNLAVLACLY